MSEPPKLNPVAVDNTPEPKAPRKRGGCLLDVLLLLGAMSLAKLTQMGAEYLGVTIPKVSLWGVFAVLFCCFLLDELIARKIFGKDRWKKVDQEGPREVFLFVTFYLVNLLAPLP